MITYSVSASIMLQEDSYMETIRINQKCDTAYKALPRIHTHSAGRT